MLGTFGCHGEATLLGKTFLVGVFGIFQSFGFHPDIFQQLFIRAKLFNENLFQIADA